MARWRISKDRPEWAIVPELPWRVAWWDGDDDCWVSVRVMATWQQAANWLTDAWPVLEPGPGAR